MSNVVFKCTFPCEYDIFNISIYFDHFILNLMALSVNVNYDSYVEPMNNDNNVGEDAIEQKFPLIFIADIY